MHELDTFACSLSRGPELEPPAAYALHTSFPHRILHPSTSNIRRTQDRGDWWLVPLGHQEWERSTRIACTGIDVSAPINHHGNWGIKQNGSGAYYEECRPNLVYHRSVAIGRRIDLIETAKAYTLYILCHLNIVWSAVIKCQCSSERLRF